MDYKKFLNKSVTQVLPYFGGAWVDTKDRRLRLKARIEPGWWQFRIEGRYATPLGPAEAPPDLSRCSKVCGHYFDHWLFVSGGEVHRMHFMPQAACEDFSLCTARKWRQGQLIYDMTDFDDEAEINVRLAFENRQSLERVKAVPATLRAAFGWAFLSRMARERNLSISIREVLRKLGRLATQGEALAQTVLDEIEQRRVYEQNRLAQEQWRRQRQQRHGLNRRNRDSQDLEQEIRDVLENADADYLGLRELEDDMLEVRFNFMEERFIAVVSLHSLQVIDAGICLEGTDSRLNLSSLPGVIREAICHDKLVITRH